MVFILVLFLDLEVPCILLSSLFWFSLLNSSLGVPKQEGYVVISEQLYFSSFFLSMVADQISCIFGLLHSDLHEERAAAVLDYMSSMVASVEPFHHSVNGQRGNSENSLSEENFSKGKFNVRFKRRNGRVKVTVISFSLLPLCKLHLKLLVYISGLRFWEYLWTSYSVWRI